MADEDQNDQIDEFVLYDAVRLLEVPLRDLLYARIESKFSWIKQGQIVWVRKLDFDSVLYWVKRDGSFLVLNGAAKLENASALLRENAGALPDGLSTRDLGAALRQLTVEPRGYVADRSFLETMRPYLSLWTSADKDLERLLVSECADAVVDRTKQAWTLHFRYMNADGGIEAWNAAGNAERVASLDMTVVVPKGTFTFPFM